MSTPRAILPLVDALHSARTAVDRNVRREVYGGGRIDLNKLRWYGAVGGEIDALLVLLGAVGEADSSLVAHELNHDVRELVELARKVL